MGIRALVERMKQLGGRLDIESDGQGTRVLASLPLSAMRPAATEEPEPADPTARLSGARPAQGT
jgi:signal transduction histidine kinase